jgi:hypothetical protein
MIDIKKHQMHETGETQLSGGEFSSAVDSFNSILKNDPHDFYALRGLLLASAHLKDMGELECEDKRKGFAYNPDMINEAIESASEEDREYFKEFGRIFSNKKRLYDLNCEINSLGEKKKQLQSQINLHGMEREYYYVRGRHGNKVEPGTMFFPYVIAGGIMFLTGLMWFIMQADLEPNWLIQALGWFCVILGIVLVGCSFIFVFPKMREVKEIDKFCKALQAELLEVEVKLKGLETEADKLSGDIRTACSDFVVKDRLRMQTER